VVEKELGFGEVKLIHKLCKVTDSRDPHIYDTTKLMRYVFCFCNTEMKDLCCIGLSVRIW
jgi:hypothetical protein